MHQVVLAKLRAHVKNRIGMYKGYVSVLFYESSVVIVHFRNILEHLEEVEG